MRRWGISKIAHPSETGGDYSPVVRPIETPISSKRTPTLPWAVATTKCAGPTSDPAPSIRPATHAAPGRPT